MTAISNYDIGCHGFFHRIADVFQRYTNNPPTYSLTKRALSDNESVSDSIVIKWRL